MYRASHCVLHFIFKSDQHIKSKYRENMHLMQLRFALLHRDYITFYMPPT